jgi:hypothetical protein
MEKTALRNLRRLAVAAATVAGLAACGGGSSGGTAPNDDIQDLVAHYQLVMADDATVPVNILFDNCDDIQIRTGELQLSDDGTWQMLVRHFDAEGNERDAEDQGQFSRSGGRLLFHSEQYGDQFKGELTPPLVHLYYDWCGEGHADVDFEFTGG